MFRVIGGMMPSNFTALWQRLCASNPSLSDDDMRVTLTARSLRSQLEKAYQQGAADFQKAADDFAGLGKGGFTASDLFDKLFK